MSYCRFSSENWKSEVYAYADVSGGFTVHVAQRKHRVVFDDEFPQLPDDWNTDEFWEIYNTQMKMLEESGMVPVKGEYAGQDFNFPDLESFLEGMKDIQSKGHCVPEYVFALIEEEIADEAVE